MAFLGAILTVGMLLGTLALPAEARLKDGCAPEVVLNVWPLPHLENELKYLLTASGYNELLGRVSERVLKRETFVTTFLDTKKGYLKDEGFNLRVRAGTQSGAITLKWNHVFSWNGEARPKMRWEVEDEIAISTIDDLLSGAITLTELTNRPVEILRANLPRRRLESLRAIGSLEVERVTAQWSSDLVLEIDRYEVGGRMIYEIEIELSDRNPDSVHAEMTSLLTEWGIAFQPTTTSKRSRLLSSLAH